MLRIVYFDPLHPLFVGFKVPEDIAFAGFSANHYHGGFKLLLGLEFDGISPYILATNGAKFLG